jgi:hypothetical protein
MIAAVGFLCACFFHSEAAWCLFLIARIRLSRRASRNRLSVGGGTAERPCVGQKFSAQEFLTNSPTQGGTTVHAYEWLVLSSIVSYGIDTTVKTDRTGGIQRNLTLILHLKRY